MTKSLASPLKHARLACLRSDALRCGKAASFTLGAHWASFPVRHSFGTAKLAKLLASLLELTL